MWISEEREPRGFAFVQFVEPYDSIEAQRRVNGQTFAGREISVVVAAESRKRPEDMRHRTRTRGGRGERSSYYGRSRSRSLSRSRSPRYPESRSRYRSRSYSPGPRHREYSASPDRRHADPGPVRSPPQERAGDIVRRSYSPTYYRKHNELEKGNEYRELSGNMSMGWRMDGLGGGHLPLEEEGRCLYQGLPTCPRLLSAMANE
ncbi:Serine/arginine-rich SC35-like splicing factor SCL30 [Linum perenne]